MCAELSDQSLTGIGGKDVVAKLRNTILPVTVSLEDGLAPAIVGMPFRRCEVVLQGACERRTNRAVGDKLV